MTQVSPPVHGPDHAPGGPDPIILPPFQAYFSYGLNTTPVSIASPNTWTTLTFSKTALQSTDFALGTEPVLLDGSGIAVGSGTKFTFSEAVEIGTTDSDVWAVWLLGIQTEWLLDNVVVDNLEFDTDMELASRLFVPNSSRVMLQTAKRVHPALNASAPGGTMGLNVDNDVNLRMEVTRWIDSGYGELQARDTFDDGIGAYDMRVQVRHTVTKETGSPDVKVNNAEFWGMRYYRGPEG